MSKKKRKGLYLCDYELPPSNCDCGNDDLALNLKYFAELTNEFTKAIIFGIRIKHGAWETIQTQCNHESKVLAFIFPFSISLN